MIGEAKMGEDEEPKIKKKVGGKTEVKNLNIELRRRVRIESWSTYGTAEGSLCTK